MKYISTRSNGKEEKSFADVVIEGLAGDGGLYVPVACPKISEAELDDLKHVDYIGIAHRVILPFVEEDIDSDTLYKLLQKSYANFDEAEIAPLKKLENNLHVLELFHGPTFAFKDFALQFLGHIFDYLLEKRQKKLTIIGATSGDTGSAAIEACRDKDNLKVFILHPKGKVSEVQRKQMTTVLSDNIYNIAIEGDFDDCQNLVKSMFGDDEFKKDMNLSAINSINWGRIVAQVVYYVFAYIKLRAKTGIEKVVFSVPTGNFGNIYAGYIAKSMGIPIEKLIIGTNSNDILFRLLETGIMKTSKTIPTISPSMDIQISSNFERVLFDLLGRDGEAVAKIMQHFKEVGPFSIDDDTLAKLKNVFIAYRFDDVATKEIIKNIYTKTSYILDPHSAIGVGAATKYLAENKDANIVAMATAHPAKFTDAVQIAIGKNPVMPEKLLKIANMEEKLVVLPNDLKTVENLVQSK